MTRRQKSNLSYNFDKVTKLIFDDNIPEENLDADIILACPQCRCEIDIFNQDHALSWMMHQQESYHKNLSARNKPQEPTQVNDDDALLKEEQRLFKKNERFWHNLPKTSNLKSKKLKNEHVRGSQSKKEKKRCQNLSGTSNLKNEKVGESQSKKKKTRCVLKKEIKAEIVDIENAEKLFRSQSTDHIPTLIIKGILKIKRLKKRQLLENIYIQKKNNGGRITLEDVVPHNFDDLISGENLVRSKSMESIPTLILKEILIERNGYKNFPIKKLKTPRILTVWYATSQNLRDKINFMKQRNQLMRQEQKTGLYNAINTDSEAKVCIDKIMNAGNLVRAKSMESLPSSILKNILTNKKRNINPANVVLSVKNDDIFSLIGEDTSASPSTNDQIKSDFDQSLDTKILVLMEDQQAHCREQSVIPNDVAIGVENLNVISIKNVQIESGLDGEIVVLEDQQEDCREKREKIIAIVEDTKKVEETTAISIDQMTSDLNQSVDTEKIVLKNEQAECREKMEKLNDVVLNGVEDTNSILITNDEIKSDLDQHLDTEAVGLDDQQEECTEKQAKLNDDLIKASTSPQSIDSIPLSADTPTLKKRRKRGKRNRTKAIKEAEIVISENMILSQSVDSISSITVEEETELRFPVCDGESNSAFNQSSENVFVKDVFLLQQEESKKNTSKFTNGFLNAASTSENVCNTKLVNDCEEILTKRLNGDEFQILEKELKPAHPNKQQVERQIRKLDLDLSKEITIQEVPKVIMDASKLINPIPHEKGTSNKKLVRNDAVLPNQIQLDENGVDSSIEFTAASFKRLLKKGLVLNTELIPNHDDNNYEWKRRNRKRIHPKINYKLDKPKHFNSLNLTLMKLRAKDEMNLIYNMFTTVKEINNWGLELEDLARKQILKTFKLNTIITSIVDTLKLMGCSNCSVHVFGSRATGLAIGDSNDLDVFIDFGVCRKFLDPSKVGNQILFLTCLRRGLRKHFGSHWVKIDLITDTRVPILKSRHRTRNIDCDISVKNSLSLCNTQLVRRFIFHLPVLRQIILLLRIWLEKCDLNTYINNYALTLLVIGSLQQENLLPSIKYINQNSEYVRVVGGWKTYDYDKCLLLSTPRKDECRISLVECLYKFFQYYHNLDFDTYVVCPYLGHLVPKVDFKNCGKGLEADIPDYFESVGSYQDAEELQYAKPICIQDPVDMSHNLTKIMPESAVRNFKMFCEISYIALRDIVCQY